MGIDTLEQYYIYPQTGNLPRKAIRGESLEEVNLGLKRVQLPHHSLQLSLLPHHPHLPPPNSQRLLMLSPLRVQLRKGVQNPRMIGVKLQGFEITCFCCMKVLRSRVAKDVGFDYEAGCAGISSVEGDQREA